MEIDTIKSAVRRSLSTEKPAAQQGRGRVIDPDKLLALQELKRRLERECGQLEAEVIEHERERDDAATLAGHIQNQITRLSDGLFGAERLVNRRKIRELEADLANARQRALAAGRRLANLQSKLQQCRDELGRLT